MGYTRWKAFTKEGGTRKSSAREKEKLTEGKSLDNDDFSLAELHEFLLAGLAAGQKENLSPVGIVK